MPKIIDHDERRREVANAVLRVVERSGLSSVTLREVAAESGWSTGVLNHYFEDKRHLMHEALMEISRQAGHNLIEASASKRSPVAKLRALLEEMLPLDERRMALCQVFSYFYGEGATGGRTAEELASAYRFWRRHVEEALIAGQANGSIRRDVDPKLVAQMLVSIADGLGLQATFDKETLPPRRLKQHVNLILRFLAPVADSPPEALAAVDGAPR